MRIMVPVKQVIDPYVSIRVKTDETGVETQNVKMSMNPFDEIAVEEAIRIKERGLCDAIIVVTIGPEKSQETLRTALALGADEAIHILAEPNLESLNIAKILCKIVKEEAFELVLMGKQAIDNDNNQTAQHLSELLGWPQATFASAIEFNNNTLNVTREIDGGLETIAVSLPAVVSTDLRLNEPRYATLPNIMKAKKKPLKQISLETLGLNLKNHIEILRVEAPPKRKAGRLVDSVESLVDVLKNEAKVI